MIIDRQTDYAIRMMRALSETSVTPVKVLCEKQKVPKQFAYKILNRLEDHHLTRSVRGVNGGYCLARSPMDITLYDIINAINSEFALNACLVRRTGCPLNTNEKPCSIHAELARIQILLDGMLKEKNLCALQE